MLQLTEGQSDGTEIVPANRSVGHNDRILVDGEEFVVHSMVPTHTDSDIMIDRLPAFNRLATDISGAGDSLLTTASLALAVGADIWRAAFLGSIAAACQVSRVGNTPLTREELIAELHL